MGVFIIVEKIDKVSCPHCGSTQVSTNGHTQQGKRSYFCNNLECTHHTFIVDYTYKGRIPEIRKKVVSMAAEGVGVRATARILGINKDTVTYIRKSGNKDESEL